MTKSNSPWLVKLLYAFQDASALYMAMEYVPGGDMRSLLRNSGVLFETHAQFFAGEILMGITALHQLGCIHR